MNKNFLLFVFTFYLTLFYTNAQIKLSNSDIKKVEAKQTRNKNGFEYYFELNGKKIGPSVIIADGIYGYYYNKKGQKHGAQIYFRNLHVKIDLYKKDKKLGRSFNWDNGNLVYAKDFYNGGEIDFGEPYRQKWRRQEECLGACNNGFGYIKYKSSKTSVLGFFKNSYPSEAVHVVSPSGVYNGSFKKGYREGNGFLISKNKKEIRHTSFKKGKAFGLELYFYPLKEIVRASYRNLKGEIIKKFDIKIVN